MKLSWAGAADAPSGVAEKARANFGIGCARRAWKMDRAAGRPTLASSLVELEQEADDDGADSQWGWREGDGAADWEVRAAMASPGATWDTAARVRASQERRWRVALRDAAGRQYVGS